MHVEAHGVLKTGSATSTTNATDANTTNATSNNVSFGIAAVGGVRITGHGPVSVVPAWTGVSSSSLKGNDTVVTPECDLRVPFSTRLYVADRWSRDFFEPSHYAELSLFGRTLRYTTNVSGAHCGCNAALYLTSLRVPDPLSTCGDNYCDANPQASGCGRCAEIDVQEANMYAWRSTLHGSADGPGLGTGWGSDKEDFFRGQYGPGGSCIDTTLPFQVAAYFGTQGMSVELSQRRNASELKSECSLPLSIVAYNSTPEIVTALYEGKMSLILSYWSAPDMGWLDGPGKHWVTPCKVDKCKCGGHVTFSDFRIDGSSSRLGGWNLDAPVGGGAGAGVGVRQECLSTGDAGAWTSEARALSTVKAAAEKVGSIAFDAAAMAAVETIAAVAEQLTTGRSQRMVDQADVLADLKRSAAAGIQDACANNSLEQLQLHVAAARAVGVWEGSGDLARARVMLESLRRGRTRIVTEIIISGVSYKSIMADESGVRVRFESALEKAIEEVTLVRSWCRTRSLCRDLGFVKIVLEAAHSRRKTVDGRILVFGAPVLVHIEVTVPSFRDPQALLKQLSVWENVAVAIMSELQRVEGIQNVMVGALHLTYYVPPTMRVGSAAAFEERDLAGAAEGPASPMNVAATVVANAAVRNQARDDHTHTRAEWNAKHILGVFNLPPLSSSVTSGVCFKAVLVFGVVALVSCSALPTVRTYTSRRLNVAPAIDSNLTLDIDDGEHCAQFHHVPHRTVLRPSHWLPFRRQIDDAICNESVYVL